MGLSMSSLVAMVWLAAGLFFAGEMFCRSKWTKSWNRSKKIVAILALVFITVLPMLYILFIYNIVTIETGSGEPYFERIGAQLFVHVRVKNKSLREISCETVLNEFSQNGKTIIKDRNLLLSAMNGGPNGNQYQPQDIASKGHQYFDLFSMIFQKMFLFLEDKKRLLLALDLLVQENTNLW